jgi:putative tricarboxylic transport membrane protein
LRRTWLKGEEKMLVRDKRDFLAGLLLLFFGLGALFVGSSYRIGTTFRMGPGFFPVVLASLLILIGIIVVCMSFRAAEVMLPKVAWRPLIVVSAAVVLFGLIINSAGLAVSTFAMVVASRVARHGYPWRETIVLAVVLSIACAAIFYFGLHIQMPLLPRWWS